jgi:hypothetical protein
MSPLCTAQYCQRLLSCRICRSSVAVLAILHHAVASTRGSLNVRALKRNEITVGLTEVSQSFVGRFSQQLALGGSH